MTAPSHRPDPSGTNRRTFMKAAGASAVVAAVSPLILHAEDKAGSKTARVGSGAFTYECNHQWGEVPSHIVWGETHGVAVDAAGLIYVKHRSDAPTAMDAIVVFDPAGKFVRSFGKEYHGGGHGIDIRKEGGEEFLYLADVKNREVIKTNLLGEHVWKFGTPQEPAVYNEEKKFVPTNIAFAPDGGFYVADGYGSHFIHQYDRDAKWVRTWGGVGTEPGKMQTPHGIMLDDRPGREPSLVVADRANARLQYFTLDGKHIGFVGEMSFPAHFDIRGDNLLVSDLHARVSILDKDNKLITHLGYDQAWTDRVLDGFKMRGQPDQWQAGRFIHPHDACYDKDGNIFVVEWVATGRVSKLTHVA